MNHQRGLAGGVDQCHARAQGLRDGGSENGIVRATEDEGGHLKIEEGLEVLGEHEGYHWIFVFAAFFDHGDQQRAGPGNHVHAGIEPADGGGIGVAGDGGLGGDQPNPLSHAVAPLTGGIHGGLGPGLQHADDGNVKFGDELIEGQGRRRVASDDQHLGRAGLQEAQALPGKPMHRGGALGAVGQAGSVAKIEDRLVRQRGAQGLDDGETAQAGVEDGDGGVIWQEGHHGWGLSWE